MLSSLFGKKSEGTVPQSKPKRTTDSIDCEMGERFIYAVSGRVSETSAQLSSIDDGKCVLNTEVANYRTLSEWFKAAAEDGGLARDFTPKNLTEVTILNSLMGHENNPNMLFMQRGSDQIRFAPVMNCEHPPMLVSTADEVIAGSSAIVEQNGSQNKVVEESIKQVVDSEFNSGVSQRIFDRVSKLNNREIKEICQGSKQQACTSMISQMQAFCRQALSSQ